MEEPMESIQLEDGDNVPALADRGSTIVSSSTVQGKAAAGAEPQDTSSSGAASRTKTVSTGPAEDKSPLRVTVGKPDLHGEGVRGYVTYEIRTHSEFPQYRETDFFVRRRYSDFEWLRAALVEEFPGYIVPPLPDKQRKQYLDHFTREFVLKRQRGLQRFVLRICKHRILRESPSLQTFLEAKTWELGSAAKRSHVEQLHSFMKTLSQDTTAAMTRAGGDAPADPFGSKFRSMETYLIALSDRMAKLNGLLKQFQERFGDLSADYLEIGPSIAMLAQSEDSLCDSLTQLGSTCDFVGKIVEKHREANSVSFVEAVKEQKLFADSALEAVRARNRVLAAWQSAVMKKVAAMDKLSRFQRGEKGSVSAFFGMLGLAEEAPETRLQDLEHAVRAAEMREQEAKQHLEHISALVEKEMRLFSRDHVRDLHATIIDFVKKQVENYRRHLSAWETLLPALEVDQPLQRADEAPWEKYSS